MRLDEYIASKLTVPFEWGSNDCVCFTIGWVEERTGVPHLYRYLPWSTEAEAMAAIARVGSLESEFDKYLRRIEPNLACDGDITVADGIAWVFVGRYLMSVGATGLVRRNRLGLTCAWSY